MRQNTKYALKRELTHEGAPAPAIDPEKRLRRTLMACLLGEKTFYEDGQSISERLAELVPLVKPNRVAEMARDARGPMNLRHAPLLVAREMVRYPTHRPYVAAVLSDIIQRPDELSEFLAIYWKDGRAPLAAQVKKGLAKAFRKFSAYSLAKYNRDTPVKLRDVLFLVHAKPKDSEQAETWKKLVAGTLESPDTWEVSLSKGSNKRETWERLLSENKLGALALLRNLRNMLSVAVPTAMIEGALQEAKTDRVLPFRFLAALRHAPQLAAVIDESMLAAMNGSPLKLLGMTAVVVDVSGSMDHALSAKSEMNRIDAAAGLAVLAREKCESCRVFSFSNALVEVPAYRGIALADAISRSQDHGATYLGQSIAILNKEVRYDRIIVVTDEQSHDLVPGPTGRGYMLNVASYKSGVGYGPWTHIDGFSERVLDFIHESEASELR